MRERHRQGLSDEELMALSGLDAAALATMAGRGAQPSKQWIQSFTLYVPTIK